MSDFTPQAEEFITVLAFVNFESRKRARDLGYWYSPAHAGWIKKIPKEILQRERQRAAELKVSIMVVEN